MSIRQKDQRAISLSKNVSDEVDVIDSRLVTDSSSLDCGMRPEHLDHTSEVSPDIIPSH